jgi:hypothetical protein
MATKLEPLVVEFGDDHSRNIYFPPLDRRIRGRFDAHQIAKTDPDAGALISEWPEPIAGQQLLIDPDTGEVALLEPLHDFPAIATRIKQRKLRLAPAREKVNCDVPTAAFYAKACIQAGQARIVRGTIPLIDESKVRHDFIIKLPETPEQTLTAALNKQTAAFERLASVLEKLLAK